MSIEGMCVGVMELSVIEEYNPIGIVEFKWKWKMVFKKRSDLMSTTDESSKWKFMHTLIQRSNNTVHLCIN